MNFDFSDDQKLLSDQVGRFLDEHCTSQHVRTVLDGEAPFVEPVWQGLADMGLLGTAIPEAYGGTGAGYLELCLVAQQLGAHLAPVPFGSTVYLLAEALLKFGSEAQKQRWLPQIAAGRLKGALATVEQLSRLTPETITCEVTDGCLSGRKLLVSDGNLADVFLVLAKSSNDELGLYIVEKSSDVETNAVETIDPTRDAAQVDFTEADCEKLCDGGWQALQALYDRAAVLYAFEQLGGAQSALEMGVAYAQERYAFGRAIGSFQAIKHMLADMYVAMKLAENNCYYAAWA